MLHSAFGQTLGQLAQAGKLNININTYTHTRPNCGFNSSLITTLLWTIGIFVLLSFFL